MTSNNQRIDRPFNYLMKLHAKDTLEARSLILWYRKQKQL